MPLLNPNQANPTRKDFDAKAFVKTLPNSAGVYQMYNEKNEILYVGKAKNLKNRVGSYFSGRPQNAKTQALVNRIASIQVTVTKTESEA
ncbi:MAG: GIY-YIG nuclease family protein, partial [Porticoccaceae bacterium]|nr:GIY-YIG nuclease family protein [Porticoccaceae bacterium]